MDSNQETALVLLGKILSFDPIRIRGALGLVEQGRAYRKVVREKSNGKQRITYSAQGELKLVQKSILEFLYHTPVNTGFLFGCVPKNSAFENALKHVYGRDKLPPWVFYVDFKKAFPTVREEHLRPLIREIFVSKKEKLLGTLENKLMTELVYDELAELTVRLVTYKGRMFEGLSTSGYLFNLLTQKHLLDKVKKYAGDRWWRFSFYVDDVVFTCGNSQRERPKGLPRELKAIFTKSGCFRINSKKVKVVITKHGCPMITGIVLTEVKGTWMLTLRQKKQDEYRQKIWFATRLLRQGIRPNFKNPKVDEMEFGFSFSQIFGYIAWVKSVTKNGKIPARLRKTIVEFEREYNKSKQNKGRMTKKEKDFKVTQKIMEELERFLKKKKAAR
jgi:hypothetical protein